MKIPKMPLRLLAGLLISIAALAVATPAEAQWCPRVNMVEQSFPIAGPEETRWRICWQMQYQFGLVITGAWFRKTPASPWVQVFYDARVSEIFVPYHGNENRFFDIKDFNWDWVRLEEADCPAATGGTLLGPGPDACKVLQNRGIAWKLDERRRLGEQVLLWGAIAAANYNYLVQWIFRDDGMVVGRVAATGANYPYHPEVAHLHSPTWRLDIDLNGASGDSAHLFVHTENLPGPTATDSGVAIPTEASFPWEADRFHGLHIFDSALKNAQGKSSMYHLMALRYGNQRHQEAYSKKDFWITRYRPGEVYGADLVTYAQNNEGVANADLVVWHTAPVHHLVRDEDKYADGDWMAHAMWAEFQLKPHNIFDRTPLYP